MSWREHGIIYQIYPRSFADSNGDGIGDLNGITGRLDYLADLGVDAIWLSPIYPSPDVDFGYDVSDYCAVDPRFGSLADFDAMLAAAHARGIRVILDLVLNHSSDQHPWFARSVTNRRSTTRDWYLWANPARGGGPPNNWQSVFGGSGWGYEPVTNQYYFHMFYKEQPDFNWRHPKLREAMLRIFEFWLARGVDGFRLDVFNVYFKDELLANNPPVRGLPLYSFSGQRHIYDCDRPELIPLLAEIRALLDRYEVRDGRPRYVVGETFLPSAEKAAQYCGPDRLHAAFEFEFVKIPLSPRAILDRIQRWERALGDENWPCYVFNNHDVPRSATRWKAPLFKPDDDARLKLAAALLLTLRGTPFIYYGEEIGMRDIPILRRKNVLDSIGKRFWPFMKGRDGCRSPMQWDASPAAGFTAGVMPWLPVHKNHKQRNVQAQLADPGSLLNFYRRLIALRRATPALTEGMFQPITFDTRYLLAYLRQTNDQTVLVALNFSGRRQRLVLGGRLKSQQCSLLLSTRREVMPAMRGGMLPLAPYEAAIYALK